MKHPFSYIPPLCAGVNFTCHKSLTGYDAER